MASGDVKLAVGMMSGTSMDGIDVALLRTDGGGFVEPVAARSKPYDDVFRRKLRAALGQSAPDPALAEELTRRHAEAVIALLSAAGISADDVDVAGFHGHTILHDPANHRTFQIGDGALLSGLLSVDVVYDFRTADVAAGGEGAPFAPIYHAALAPDARPVCFLNIGGVANLTWIGADADPSRPDVFDHLLAFDTGPGNALIDDFVQARTGAVCDWDGKLAASGRMDRGALAALMAHPYFEVAPPKSLDRNDFDAKAVGDLSDADGAATLSAFTVQSIARAARFLPAPPVRWLVTGGGRKNAHLLIELAAALDAPVVPTEAEGIDGDALEAQAFAYLAVRCLRGWPLSGPNTTGVPAPQTGGQIVRARAA